MSNPVVSRRKHTHIFAGQHGTNVRVALAIGRLTSKQTQICVGIQGGNDDSPSRPPGCDHEYQNSYTRSARVYTSTTLRILEVTQQTRVRGCKKINQDTDLFEITQSRNTFNQDKHMKFDAVGKLVFPFSPFLRQEAHFIPSGTSLRRSGT